MLEPVEIKIARIEDGMVALHEKLDTHHQKIMLILEPLTRKTEQDHDELCSFKRDRYWIFGILLVFGICLAKVYVKLVS